jgi:hypothetical protein
MDKLNDANGVPLRYFGAPPCNWNGQPDRPSTWAIPTIVVVSPAVRRRHAARRKLEKAANWGLVFYSALGLGVILFSLIGA